MDRLSTTSVVALGGLLTLSLAAFTVPAPVEDAPVPSFARRYNLSCSACHTVFPALNEYGRLFRAKGYRLPGAGETVSGEAPLSLGPAGSASEVDIPVIDIPATSVAGFQVLSDLKHRPDEDVSTEFTGISSVGLIFGGAMGRRFSFFGNVALVEDGRFEGIDRLFLQYNRSLGFNVRVGQFEPRAIPFSNHRRLLRITPYLNGVFPIIPAQNFLGFSPNQKGVELFGRVAGPGGFGDLEYALGVVNGEPGGAFEALEESEGPVGDVVRELEEAYEEAGGEFDVNNQKDYYARLNYTLWLRGTASVGVFGYRGTAGFLMDPDDAGSFVRDGNDFNRWGVDVRWEQEQGYLSLLGSVQFFNDNLERPAMNKPSATVTTGEVQFYLLPRFVPGFRYERVALDGYPPGSPSSFGRYSVDVLTLLGPNLMLMVGPTWSSESAPDLPLFAKFARISLHLAF